MSLFGADIYLLVDDVIEGRDKTDKRSSFSIHILWSRSFHLSSTWKQMIWDNESRKKDEVDIRSSGRAVTCNWD